MKKWHWLGVAMACLCLGGCSLRTGPTRVEVTALKAAPAITMQGKKTFVVMPADFSMGESVRKESGAQTQMALQKALQKKGVRAAYDLAPCDTAQALAAAVKAGSDYLLVVRILRWEDPPASFQISPDRGEVALTLLDAGSGEVLRQDNVACSGVATTINYIGFYSPKDCLPEAFGEWADTAFAKDLLPPP